ncbi:response regulator transcription factor [Neobacillus rhizophilus]|uniref:Response regulator transcription factor n=1 Tax=Neobacillus rhizophilus TaxID=2833579 RepID=A0A942U659_9BACI|nr:LuxR C-terminal-related transcriptional regulator [Neobacillus rhizophilus]MBS4213622.1 response regulator transcription factor [Neobacillus rhizophilus]
MEEKVERLLLKGLSILYELSSPFLKEWKELMPSLKYRNQSLVDEIDVIIQFAIKDVFQNKNLNADSFILSLLAEWQKRFSSKYDEYEALSLITTIENMFHKLLDKDPESTFLDHQAIQSFFIRILDQALLSQDMEYRNDNSAKIIIETNVLPMKWVAIVKKDKEEYVIDSVVCSNENPVDNHLLEMCKSLKARETGHLSMAIERLIGQNSGDSPLIQIPCLNDTLLICLENENFQVKEQQIVFIREMYLHQLKLYHLESKIDWKNTSLLFLQHLLLSRSAGDAVNAITTGLVEYMPFERCALFLYNQYEEKGIGVSGHNVSTSSVQQIREEIFKLPLIKKYLNSLTHSQPLYFSNAAEVLPEKYIHEFKLRSLVVLPIFVPTKNKLIGIAILDQGEYSDFLVSNQTLTTLIKFGHYAGELLFSIWDEALQQFGSFDTLLTPREKDVLKLIAEGASISEAAKELHLSSYTVRDYVSVIIQKLEAKNRTDAAVKAIKMKLIS